MGSDMEAADSRIHMIGHAHLDAVWLWPWTESYQEVRATLRSAVQLLSEDPAYVFTVEQVVFLDWLRESDPELFEEVRTYVSEGRISLAGGWWVEPDANLPALESFVRHGLYGQRFLEQHFGQLASVAFNVDSFGHSATLPQILAKQNIEAYCFLRPGPHESELDQSLFSWQGLDGTALMAYRIPHEYCSPGDDLRTHMEHATQAITPTATGDSMVFYGVGNHGGGPTRENLESIARLNRTGEFGQLVFATPRQFFDTVAASSTHLPTWSSELQHHAVGTYSTLSNFKKLHVQAENLLNIAERYSSIATRSLAWPYPHRELEAAWKLLLFNQFHDVLPGTSLESAHRDADRQLGAAFAHAQMIANRALQRVASKIDIPLDAGTQPIVVFNPHCTTVEGFVEIEFAFPSAEWTLRDSTGTRVPFQYIQAEATINEAVDSRGLSRRRIGFRATVPGLGYAVYSVEAADHKALAHERPPSADLPAQVTLGTEPPQRLVGHIAEKHASLTNGIIEIEIDSATGWISEFVNLRSGHRLRVPSDRAHTVVTRDTSDTWGHGVRSYVAPGASFTVNSVTVVENGPLRAAVRVDSSFGSSRMSETFRLTAGSDHLQVDVILDWREPLSVLKLRVPLGVSSRSARYQLQYGYIERPADSREYPGQRWVTTMGRAGGRDVVTSVITDAKYGYDCTEGEIGITALRSPAFAWHDPRELDPTERYSFQDQGLHSFTYAVHVALEDDHGRRAGAIARELGMPLDARLESFHKGPLALRAGYLDCSSEGHETPVEITTVKIAEESERDLIIRTVNNFPSPAESVLSGPLIGGNRHSVNLSPFEVDTLRITADSHSITQVDLLEKSHDAGSRDRGQR
ncbi:alpha-mannosidase [Ruaniaceae bacterium KH17]|nr:alpha-mannosidase [Ruaniaceae bacterium KH17]